MIREPESGVLRAIQTWVAEQIRAIQAFHTENVFVMTEDEGDYESELEKQINRHRICAFVFTTSLDKVDHVRRTASVMVRVLESVALRRSHNRVVHWTALRVAEKILANLDHARMDEAPWGVLECEGQCINLESQIPYLVYDVKLQARLKVKYDSE